MRNTAGAVVLVGMLGAGCGAATVGGSEDRPSITSPGAKPPTANLRLVGLGHATIAVPDAWGTNVTRCGVPQKDTVVIDVGAVPACGTGRPARVDSVEIEQGPPPFDFETEKSMQVDGVPAERQQTTCAPGGFGSGRVCTGTLYLPSLRVWFRAESSTSAAVVGRILQRIQIMPDRVGVPGFQEIALYHQGRAETKYSKALRRAGLIPRIRTKRMRAIDPGYVLDATPTPGTMVQPGTVITVTVVAG